MLLQVDKSAVLRADWQQHVATSQQEEEKESIRRIQQETTPGKYTWLGLYFWDCLLSWCVGKVVNRSKEKVGHVLSHLARKTARFDTARFENGDDETNDK